MAKPDIVVVFLGGNDLDSGDVDAMKMASSYAAEYNKLSAMGWQVVIRSWLWPKPGSRIGVVNTTGRM